MLAFRCETLSAVRIIEWRSYCSLISLSAIRQKKRQLKTPGRLRILGRSGQTTRKNYRLYGS